jgi:hypothetical protein
MSSQPSQPQQSDSGISVKTLIIASASSVVAAIVVSRVWGPGTLIGAAVTPVIVTLVSEALKKPAEVITVVRPTGTRVHERAQPRRREVAADDLEAGDTVVAAPAATPRARRPAVIAALVTGLVAAAIGIFVLTSGELVFGDPVGLRDGGTTVFGGGGGNDRGPRETTTPTTTETQTTTETVLAPPPPTPEESDEAPPTAPPEGTTARRARRGRRRPSS